MPRLLLTLLALLLSLSPAMALESAPVTSPRATVTLVSETDSVAPGQNFRLGLHFQMSPGWHTYWQNPGDAGLAPTLDFSLPLGLTASAPAWPAPSRNAEGPLMTYGYSGDLLLPVAVTGAHTGAVAVDLKASWLICKDICVPEQGSFHLDLPAGAAIPSADTALFTLADARVPQPSPWRAQIAPDGMLSIAAPPGVVQQASFIPNTSGTLVDAAPQPLSSTATGVVLALKPGADFRPDLPLSGVLLVQDRTGQTTALQIAASPGHAVAPTPFWRILGLAFLGGLILNLMPCVFPILAMKAVGITSLVGKRRGHAWGHAFAYTAGVVVTFCLIALVLLVVRQSATFAGSAVGWGFQFQSPAFVAAIAWLLFGVGLNLSGVFAIGSAGTGAGQSLAGTGGLTGSFFTGLLAVLVASPCTAPFMGVAIAAGLAATGWTTLAVFVAMGLGLAAPYVALATIPAVTRLLPRPGAWMDLLKQLLAFPMYAACAWLVWVLAQEAGASGILAAGAGLVLIGFAAWVLGLSQSPMIARSRVLPRLSAMLSVLAVIAAVAILPTLATATDNPAPVEAGAEPFSTTRLADLQAAGTPVLVNMTASWCVSCLVNERVALSTDAVRQSLQAHGVIYMKGDWTRQNPAITAFLRSHNRDGVPFYLLYPGKNRPPEELPQLLTQGTVLKALDSVGG